VRATTASGLPICTIGLDLGDRKSAVCVLDEAGAIVTTATIATTRDALTGFFTPYAHARAVCEVGTHSPWVARLLAAVVREVWVANPSQVHGRNRRRQNRNDRSDAEQLARIGRADPQLLHAIRHRRAETQAQLARVRAREAAVQMRTALINHVRGSVKAVGGRLPAHDARLFASTVRAHLPAALALALTPLLDTIAALTDTITQYDQDVDALQAQYPVTARFRAIRGIGPLTAVTFVLLIDAPTRFRDSRDVGAYFGLAPRLDHSGDSTPQLGITKQGDRLGRTLLVNAAHYILGPFGTPCALRRYGEAMMARGGPNAKKRAVIAVARKLAVLLHHLWITGRDYDPEPVAELVAA
jgi:transposase